MNVSRWCAATEPEVWTSLGLDGEPDQDFNVSPHDRCLFERRNGHEDPSHRDCCWGPGETESRDCTCECHTVPAPAGQERTTP